MGIEALYFNPLTKFRDPVQFGNRYAELESLKLRQQVGDITKDDVAELNEKFGGAYSISSKGSPKRLYAYHKNTVYAGGIVGTYFTAMGLMKGYSMLWLVGGFVPLFTSLIYNKTTQPEQLFQNCYAYLIAKKQASVEMHEQQKKFNENRFVKSSEYSKL